MFCESGISSTLPERFRNREYPIEIPSITTMEIHSFFVGPFEKNAKASWKPMKIQEIGPETM